MRRRFRLLFLIIVILPTTASAQPAIGFGGGTGLFFAPNPGDAYALPVSTTGLIRLSTPDPVPISYELSLALLPYIATDELFGRSLMSLLEARIQERIAEVSDGEANATISVGIAKYRADETEESLLRRADHALYGSKEAGRNRITVAE